MLELTEEMLMTKLHRIFLVVVTHIGGSIYLLGRELPAMPIHWWGWVVPFLLPMPIYFFLSKLEIPKEPVSLQQYLPETRFFVWDFKLATVFIIVYFMLLLLIWFVVKPFLYES
jgi:hypothetical protein